MSKSTGPVLAIGAITIANRMIFHDESFEWKVPVATGITAGMFALFEKAWEPGAVALAWLALVAVLLTRLDPKVPAPIETLNDFLNGKGKK